jgi:hypothetical protein
MAGLQAYYSARDIEARILAAVRAAGLNPEQRLAPRDNSVWPYSSTISNHRPAMRGAVLRRARFGSSEVSSG